MTESFTSVPGSPDFYSKFVSTIAPGVKRYSRLQVKGLEHLPPQGEGFILAGNHAGSHWWDAFCLATAIEDRHIHFIAHHWDAKIKMLRDFQARMGGYPLDEHLADIHQDSPICQALTSGKLLCIYPEESYHSFRDRYTLFRFAPQVVKYAQLAQVPIIPVVAIGVEEAAPVYAGIKFAKVPIHVPLHPVLIFPFQVTIEFGPPVYASELADNGPLKTEQDYLNAAQTLRLRLHSIINQYRECKLDDTAYIDAQKWF